MMKYIVSIYLWVIGFISITIILIIGLIFTYLFSQKTYDPWFKKILRIFFRILNIKVIVEGDNKFDQQTPYLFMSNHFRTMNCAS